MYYQRNYGNRYGGNYHNYSTQNRMMPHQQRMPEKPHMNENKEFPIAMAYVPWQTWGNLYDTCDAMYQGTIFKELNLRFCG
ncbi:MAG: spore coat associated protein CotJA [Lachnospiraceae bacterium]